MSKSLVEMCTDIVSAQASHTPMSSEDIAESLRHIFRTLQEVQHIGDITEQDEGVPRDPQSSIACQRIHRSIPLSPDADSAAPWPSAPVLWRHGALKAIAQ